jgi:DNA-binding transcriptional LysR family regulator
MNLRFVEAFYWVVTLRSVTRAAEKLHLTQSAMSSRVAALEQELGTLLLDRRDKQFRVTAAGQRFFGYAEKLLALQREIKSELGAVEAQPMRLRVGAIESVLHSWLMDWVHGLRAAQPSLALELTVETSPVLLDQLLRGTLDIALAALPAGGGVASRQLPPMEMVFVGHADIHRRRRWALGDLAALELLTFQRGSQPQVALSDLLQRAGLEPLRLHTVSSISAMAQLVVDGLGVATLPRAVVNRLAERMPLRVLACDTALPPLPLHVSWRDDPASQAQRALIDSLPMQPVATRTTAVRARARQRKK